MATATINSLLLSTDDPDALARWYATAFEASIRRIGNDDGGYRVIDLDGFFVMIDQRADVSGPNALGARLILNLDVADPQTTGARLDALGATWISPLENRGGATFGTVADPDGNWLQLIRLDDQSEAQMGGGTTPYAGFAVTDLAAASSFYRDVLGMRVLQEMFGVPGLVGIHIDGRTLVTVVENRDHVPAHDPILTIPAFGIDEKVADLRAHGVELVRLPGFDHDDRGVVRGVDSVPDRAWIRDPSGNLIALIGL